ncbi:MAG TPA: hypothetical protein VF600_07035 [Abditibacteriaceae bacterium]|jgi:hypothetical protein
MPIYNIYSKRRRGVDEDVPEVYVYDVIPPTLRAQVVQIVRDGLGNPVYVTDQLDQVYKSIRDILCREYGLMSLPDEGRSRHGYQVVVEEFFLRSADLEQALDVIELAFRLIESLQTDAQYGSNMRFSCSPQEAIDELNHRFREHRIGYQFECGEIIRVNSTFLHAEAVKPALCMLTAPMYQGANAEFLSAHEHYRHDRYKECLNECLKAFESTMKAICDKRNWAYDARATSNQLITVCLNNNLIPSFLQSQFASLRASLESGIPTVRNRLSGHGQGSQQLEVPEYLAGYLLHLTASTILLLVKAEEELP